MVKGVNFVNLRDAGDPVELAERYNEQGADELVFLDITASSDARDIMVRRGGADGAAGLHPADGRRRDPLRDRCAGHSEGGRGQSERQHGGGAATGTDHAS